MTLTDAEKRCVDDLGARVVAFSSFDNIMLDLGAKLRTLPTVEQFRLRVGRQSQQMEAAFHNYNSRSHKRMIELTAQVGAEAERSAMAEALSGDLRAKLVCFGWPVGKHEDFVKQLALNCKDEPANVRLAAAQWTLLVGGDPEASMSILACPPPEMVCGGPAAGVIIAHCQLAMGKVDDARRALASALATVLAGDTSLPVVHAYYLHALLNDATYWDEVSRRIQADKCAHSDIDRPRRDKLPKCHGLHNIKVPEEVEKWSCSE